MKLLTANEVEEQNLKKNFKNNIKKICEAFSRGLLDRCKNRGYHGGEYKDLSLETSYDIGWNYDFMDK